MYGPSFEDAWPEAARYIDRIFEGARPADLSTVLLKTDEVIE